MCVCRVYERGQKKKQIQAGEDEEAGRPRDVAIIVRPIWTGRVRGAPAIERRLLHARPGDPNLSFSLSPPSSSLRAAPLANQSARI